MWNELYRVLVMARANNDESIHEDGYKGLRMVVPMTKEWLLWIGSGYSTSGMRNMAKDNVRMKRVSM